MKKKQKQKQQHQYLESIIQLAFSYIAVTYNFLLSDTDQQSEVSNIIIKFACKVISFIYTALLLGTVQTPLHSCAEPN